MTDEELIKHYRDQQAALNGGCSDGYCVIEKTVGMHTNGGCGCLHNLDFLGMQRVGVMLKTAQIMADRIEQLTAKLKVLEKVELRLKTMYPDKSGHYFICGEGGVKDDNDLPERLHVCPAYGADWAITYQRTDKTFGPEW